MNKRKRNANKKHRKNKNRLKNLLTESLKLKKVQKVTKVKEIVKEVEVKEEISKTSPAKKKASAKKKSPAKKKSVFCTQTLTSRTTSYIISPPLFQRNLKYPLTIHNHKTQIKFKRKKHNNHRQQNQVNSSF